MSTSSSTEQVEDRCLDAEAWADELDLWRPTSADSARLAEAGALAAMLRALVKSIRLSLFAEGDPQDRGYLVEELDATIEMARTFATETGAPVASRAGRRSIVPTPPALVRDEDDDRPPPTIRPFDHATARPPPGLNTADLFDRAPTSDELTRMPHPKKWKMGV